jgi:hypothetical protein
MNQGPRYVHLMEKSRGQKSRATVPLSQLFGFFLFSISFSKIDVHVLDLLKKEVKLLTCVTCVAWRDNV